MDTSAGGAQGARPTRFDLVVKNKQRCWTRATEVTSCNLNKGNGAQDIADLARHMGEVMTSFGADGPNFAAVRQPVTSGPNFPDLFIFSVFDDMTHWSKYVMQLFGTDDGRLLRRHIAAVVDCNISM